MARSCIIACIVQSRACTFCFELYCSVPRAGVASCWPALLGQAPPHPPLQHVNPIKQKTITDNIREQTLTSEGRAEMLQTLCNGIWHVRIRAQLQDAHACKLNWAPGNIKSQNDRSAGTESCKACSTLPKPGADAHPAPNPTPNRQATHVPRSAAAALQHPAHSAASWCHHCVTAASVHPAHTSQPHGSCPPASSST